jgi:hypothetical protein
MIEETKPLFDANLVVRKASNNLKEVRKVSNIFSAIAPYILAAGNELVNIDEDSLGGDDFAGQLLILIGESGIAIQNGQDIDLTELPEVIRIGTTDKLSSKAKFTLRLVSTFLSIGQTQVNPSTNVYKLLKYATQAIRLLIANKPVAPFVV